MSDLVWKSMVELARLVRTKAVSPVEVVQAHLDRIAALDGKARAYITVMGESARAAAQTAEAAVMSGEALGPLHGVPIGLKDLYCTRGVKTTGGSRLLGDWVPAEDATVVSRLTVAGGIVLGKLNMHEFAYGPEGVNAHYGTPWNPWDAGTHRVCGGSSSGSGAAVALGLCPGTLGSDTGGSIRIPASLCGISGIKPTYGRVSRAGVLPLAWSLDHVGPMCRSAADCALMLGAMAGYDPRDPTTSVVPVPDYVAALTGEIKGVRVGLLRPFFMESAGAPQRRAVEQAVKVLEGLGASVKDVNLELVTLAAAASTAIIATEAYAYHEPWLKTRAGEYGSDVLQRLRVGAFFSGADYLNGQRARVLIKNDVDAALAALDVLVAPTTPIAATPVGESDTEVDGEKQPVRASLIRFTRPFNVSGHPALSVPCGLTPEGLPIGLQIVGRPFDEATVLRVADAYQRATDWHARRPPLDA
ncbi:MAG TPA: amidase [Methylomirabilota bacterium]|jgi:aspartyl-tRNA(Asn)/glutamyl-tRNA(Gln) amidotransferase subunit A|nr:amidase [Methylomirabilota bacterium]